MTDIAPLIYILDDDESVLKALKRLIKSVGFKAKTFASASEFVDFGTTRKPDCLILDVQMPEVTGIELMERLNTQGINIPAIFITAHDDDQTRERVKSTGALAYLRKPFNDESLIDAIHLAIDQSTDEVADYKGKTTF